MSSISDTCRTTPLSCFFLNYYCFFICLKNGIFMLDYFSLICLEFTFYFFFSLFWELWTIWVFSFSMLIFSWLDCFSSLVLLILHIACLDYEVVWAYCCTSSGLNVSNTSSSSFFCDCMINLINCATIGANPDPFWISLWGKNVKLSYFYLWQNQSSFPLLISCNLCLCIVPM